MKKFISILLAVVILTGALGMNLFAFASGSEATKEFAEKLYRCDYNGDKTVSSEDARTVLAVAVGIEMPDETKNYDLDGDGSCGVSDVRKVLRIASGIDPAVSNEETIEYFNSMLNSVKTEKPGFEVTSVQQCSSMLVTTTGAPIASLNVTNMEFNKYVEKMKTLFTLIGNTEEYNQMKKEADEIYKPQTTVNTVTKGSNKHFTYFPVANLSWASHLTADDIKKVTLTDSASTLTITVLMNNYTYVGNEYPAGSTGFKDRQQLPYGKVFNLPASNQSDGVDIGKVILKDGKIVVTVDKATGAISGANYSYGYELTAHQNDSSTSENINMTTTQKVTLSDVFKINLPAAE